MGIMEIFNSFRGVENSPPQRTEPSSPTTTSSNTAAANPTVPSDKTPRSDGSNPAIPAAAEGVKSPLEKYNELWKTDPKAKPPVSPVPTLNADPVKLMEAASNVDFTKVIPPELLQKASSGDQTALGQVINAAAQAAYAQSAAAASKIVEQSLNTLHDTYTREIIPQVLRNHSISQTVGAGNPLSENPAAAPILDAVRRQVTAKNPGATPAQIKEMTSGFLNELAELVIAQSGKKITDPDPIPGSNPLGLRAETDWEKFMGV
jgi:hypothetical protein